MLIALPWFAMLLCGLAVTVGFFVWPKRVVARLAGVQTACAVVLVLFAAFPALMRLVNDTERDAGAVLVVSGFFAIYGLAMFAWASQSTPDRHPGEGRGPEATAELGPGLRRGDE